MHTVISLQCRTFHFFVELREVCVSSNLQLVKTLMNDSKKKKLMYQPFLLDILSLTRDVLFPFIQDISEA